MTERSRLVLPNGQRATQEAPKVINTTIDADGNKLVFDAETGAVIVFGKNGCLGFADARGTTMRTTPEGVIEFICSKVKFLSEEQPEFIQYSRTQNTEET